ncbi:MAG: TonB-dependent outer membrane protein SusC/RagA [Gemmatimonadetes bacterium]|jgi:TonB-linked SusC/RagA family outer membrane protein|nr:TonB-dependent outer membrane protein SusC/RagA [Gemmatimonadota bacterium]
MRLAAALALAAAPLAPAVLDAPLFAQVPLQGTGRITGTVTGDAAQPVEGVQVSLANTRYGALTNAAGRYTIAGVPAGSYQLRAQRVGWRPVTQSVTVSAGGVATVDLRMESQPTRLAATVVVGYTTQQRRDISDATAGVEADVVQQQQVATVEEALRGRIAGVQVNASGEPGRPAQVIIRGQNFLGNPTPLYVVDGMYLRQNPNLNPDDIESIEVLKDASAAAQYGAQAANGVIVIRTRRGRASDDNRVDLRSYYGTQAVPKRIAMMNSRDWAAIQQQAYQNSGLPVPSGVTAALTGNSPSTDWQDAVFRDGAIRDNNLSVSGGTANASYLISGGVLDQQGSIIETNFRRYSIRVNSDVRRGRFTLGENIALSRGLRQGLVDDPLTGFPLINMIRMLPTIPVRDPANASGYGYGSGATPTFGTSPVGLLEQRPQRERSNQVIGSTFGEFQIFNNLKYRLNLGLNYENYGRSEFRSVNQIRMGSPNQFADLREIRNDFTSLLAENLLSFDDQFGEAHRVSAVAGYTEQTTTADDVTAFRRGFSDENLRTINAGGEANSSNSGVNTRSALRAMLFRANYTLLNRYIFTGSVRRDGSSRFGPSYRWGTFSAGSVGWIVSDEGFFRSVPLLGNAGFLKLRASTGTLGNQDIGDYRYAAPLEQNRLGYPFGGGVLGGATQTALANEDIRWQSNRQSNAGLDLSMMDERLTLSVDAYRSTSTGLLVSAPLPWSLGVPDRNLAPVVNAGSMRNSGVELSLSHRMGADAVRGAAAATQGFRLNTTATLTTTRNTVLSLGNGGQPLFDQTGAARTAVGSPVGTFYLVRTAGIFQTPAEVQAHTTTVGGGPRVIQPGAQPGDVRFVDSNADGLINDDDRVEIGNGTPKYSGGLFFDAGLRNFDLGLNLRGAGGFKIFNAVRYWTDRMDDPSNYRAGFTPWTPTNPSTTTPRALAAGNANTRFLSDRWVEDGDFLRVQNVVLGYRLPASLARNLGSASSEARVYLNVQNLHTFSGFSNWDPETLGFGNPLGRGIDDGRIYPNVRTITVGLDLRL